MRSFTCVSVVVYVARKLRPCPSYSGRRDRINLGLWRSLYKGGGGYTLMLNSAISVHAVCFVGKVCGPLLVDLGGFSRGG